MTPQKKSPVKTKDVMPPAEEKTALLDPSGEPYVSQEDAPVAAPPKDMILPMEQWTLRGIPVADLPVHEQAVVCWAHTDQAAAQRKARVDAAGWPRLEVVSDTTDMQVHEFEREQFVADPLSRIAEPHRKPGMAYRFLSGDHRGGVRDFRVVKDPQTGEPVRYRGLVLGEQPETLAKARKKFHEGNATSALRNNLERHQETQEAAIAASRSSGISPLRMGQTVTDSADPNRAAAIGVSHTRGTGANAA